MGLEMYEYDGSGLEGQMRRGEHPGPRMLFRKGKGEQYPPMEEHALHLT